MRYVEQNPVRAKLVRAPWRYRWSSAHAHVTGKDMTGLLDMKTWLAQWPPEEWRLMLRSGIDEKLTVNLRRCTDRGQPLGSDSFVSKMESLLGRPIRPRPVGRPVGWRKQRGKKAKK